MSRARGATSPRATAGGSPARQAWWAVPLLLSVLAMPACQPRMPQVPSTNWTLRIPVADSTFTIASVAEDAGYLEIGDDQSMGLRISQPMGQRETLGDRLSVKPVRPTPVETQLGAITIPGETVDVPPIAMADLIGQEIPDTGIALPFPATGIESDVELDLSNRIQELEIIEGGIVVTITNGLPVPLIVELELFDNSIGGVVASIDFGRIESGSAPLSDTFDLDGASMSGDLAIRVVGTTVDVGDVLVEGNPALQIQAEILELKVSRAVAKIPQQDLPESRLDIDFPDDRIQVTSAEIRQGGLSLSVRNDIPIIVSVTLTLADFQDEGGNKLALTIDGLKPGETQEKRFVLDDFMFLPENPLQLRVLYSAKTDSTNDFKEIASDAQIVVNAETEELLFGEVQGILNNLQLDQDPVVQTLDIPEGLDNLAIATTSLEAWVTSGVGFGSSIELLIEGTNNAGKSLGFTIAEDFEAGDPDQPRVIRIAPESEQLTDFLNLLPSEITVTPTIKVGDGESTERIAPEHWVQVDSVVFESEARFEIKANDRINPKPQNLSLNDEEARIRISNNLISSSVITKIENGIPLAVRVSLQVSANEDSVYTNPILTIPRDGEGFGVEAAPTDPATGRSTGSSESLRTVVLEKEELLVFLREGGVFTGVLVEFDDTDGFVELRASDQIRVQAATEVLLELNESLVQGR